MYLFFVVARVTLGSEQEEEGEREKNQHHFRGGLAQLVNALIEHDHSLEG